MADEIINKGWKGYIILGIFVAFLLFIALWASVYYYNFKFLPA